MTKIYFVRHAQSDISVKEDMPRPLTTKGLADCGLVTEFLRDKGIDAVLSSPYKRAADTVAPFAGYAGLDVEIVADFRERRFGAWVEDFAVVARKQWEDFDFKPDPESESLREVQARNVAALKDVLAKYQGKNITIGTHGTALSTIINYYDDAYGFKDFAAMVHLMPWVVVMDFEGESCVGIAKVDLFEGIEE
jgi:2,3-bisphosphoglycerate-dependent phosphoglycerate mutase